MNRRLIVLVLIVLMLGASSYAYADPCCQTADYSPDGLTLLWTDGSFLVLEHPPAVQVIPFGGIYHLEFMDNQSALLNRNDGALFSMNTITGQISYLGGLPADWTIYNCCQEFASYNGNSLATNLDSLTIIYNGIMYRFGYPGIVHVQWLNATTGVVSYPNGSVYYLAIPSGVLVS